MKRAKGESGQFAMRGTESLLEHCAVRAWDHLRPERTEPESLEIIKLGRTSEVYRLAGVGSDGSAVIAKKYPVARSMVERTVYQELLSRLPIPTLHCYGWVKDTKNDCCWLFLEEPKGIQYSPLSQEHRALAGQWLGTIHSIAARSGGAVGLPGREPSHYLTLLRTSRAKIREVLANPSLTEEDIKIVQCIVSHCDLIESRWDDLEDMCRDLPRTLVHGDFAAKNVRVKAMSADSAFVVLDWGMAGWGIPAADLAQSTGHAVSPDFNAYRSAMKRCGMPLDLQDIRRLADCGKIFRLLDAIAWACSWEASASYPQLRRPISLLGIYAPRLAEAMRAVWGIESGGSAIATRCFEDDRIRHTLSKIVNRLNADPAVQEDLMQEGLIRLWKVELEQPGRTRSWYLQNCKFHLRHWLKAGRSLDSRKRVNADNRVTLDGVNDDTVCPTEDQVFQTVSARDIVATLAVHLAPCERAVVGALADGLHGHEIATRLNLSYPTVLKYRRKIASLTVKLGISTPTRATSQFGSAPKQSPAVYDEFGRRPSTMRSRVLTNASVSCSASGRARTTCRSTLWSSASRTVI